MKIKKKTVIKSSKNAEWNKTIPPNGTAYCPSRPTKTQLSTSRLAIRVYDSIYTFHNNAVSMFVYINIISY